MQSIQDDASSINQTHVGYHDESIDEHFDSVGKNLMKDAIIACFVEDS